MSAIRKTTLLTVEGERNAICAAEWRWRTTCAAKLRSWPERHHMQAGIGHYGVFSGTRWERQIYPILKNVILSSD